MLRSHWAFAIATSRSLCCLPSLNVHSAIEIKDTHLLACRNSNRQNVNESGGFDIQQWHVPLLKHKVLRLNDKEIVHK